MPMLSNVSPGVTTASRVLFLAVMRDNVAAASARCEHMNAED
jgi:hypothetical protein